MTKHRIYSMSFASVYPHYVAKAEKKARTRAEVALWAMMANGTAYRRTPQAA